MQRIVKPLLRHPAMPMLVVLQVAMACAIACNALFLLQQELAPILAPTGVSHPDTLLTVVNLFPRGKPWNAARLRGVEADLRALPGVAAISYTATIPGGSGGLAANVVGKTEHDRATATVYLGDNLVATLGLQLVAGRDFTTEEKHATLGGGMGFHQAGPVIVTRALANRLFPDGHALGRQIDYSGSAGSVRTVVGVVKHLMPYHLGGNQDGSIDDTMLFPGIPKRWTFPAFVVRAEVTPTARLRKAILGVVKRDLGADLLASATPAVVTYAQLQDDMLAGNRAATWLLSGIALVVLVVTLTGIAGMTSYRVRQRTRQIGVHRALGARRSAVLLAFHMENMLIVGVGVSLGMVAACGVNIWLMQHHAFARLPLHDLPIGALVFLVAGQLAVGIPAWRATRIPPIAATRAA